MIVVLFFLVYQDLEKSVDAKDPKRVKVREESRWVIIEKINKLQELLPLLFYMYVPLFHWALVWLLTLIIVAPVQALPN